MYIPLYVYYYFWFCGLLLTSVSFENKLKPRNTRLDHTCVSTINQFLDCCIVYWIVLDLHWNNLYNKTAKLEKVHKKYTKYFAITGQIKITLFNDRKCLIVTSNGVSSNNNVGSKLCLVYCLHKNMCCELKSICTTVWQYYAVYIIIPSKNPLYSWSGIS